MIHGKRLFSSVAPSVRWWEYNLFFCAPEVSVGSGGEVHCVRFGALGFSTVWQDEKG